MSNVILNVKNLQVSVQERGKTYTLVYDSDFCVNEGECLGILGESGSGKSMTVKSIMGLLDTNFKVTGEAWFHGKDLLKESKESLRNIRGSKIAMVLQNPMTSFDPLCRISSQIAETFQAHTDWDAEKIREKSMELLEQMQIREPLEVLQKYPHQLSGGMIQRIMVGIALSMEPDLLVADEPTTALDAITQHEVLKAFREIKREKKTSMIFITHDLGAISYVADRILVMNQGRIVDEGSFHDILCHAKDPYTRMLAEKKCAVMEQYRRVLGKGRGML